MKIFSLYLIIFLLLFTGCQKQNIADTKISETQGNSNENCYQKLKLENFYHPNHTTDILIVIDQTTPLSKRLEAHLLQQLEPLYVEGNTITIAEVSTFSKDYYTRIVDHTIIDSSLTYEDEQSVPKNKIKKIQKCIQKQSEDARSMIPTEIKKTLSNSKNSIDQSELFKSFQDLANSTLKKSSSGKNVILIVSDMLEHSSVTSFYGKNINPVQELKRIKNIGLLADFQGAKVYIVGAGSISDNNAKRTIQDMQNLKKFWQLYFTASNAELVEFGAPELLNPIKP